MASRDIVVTVRVEDALRSGLKLPDIVEVTPELISDLILRYEEANPHHKEGDISIWVTEESLQVFREKARE